VVLPCESGSGEQMVLKLTPDLEIAADEATALDSMGKEMLALAGQPPVAPNPPSRSAKYDILGGQRETASQETQRMTEQDEQARHESWIAIGVRIDVPHPARVYNYLLGGKDNFAADRARAVMADNQSIISVAADLRHVDEVLSAAGKLLDLAQPVGLLFVASLHNIPDADDPAGIVRDYLAALAPGSYVVISHVTGDFAPEQMAEVTASYAERGAVFIGRTRSQITDMFNGRELVDPGVVQISYWRPDGGTPAPNAGKVWGYAGVARV
jgi:S-adenosyl methyltransferase